MTQETTIFGRYQLLERIAEGGMAEVFKAKLVAAAGTEKLLCIKRIRPALSHNHDFISLFVREARIALSLTHGNITQVFDFGEVEGVYYLAMEYISGQDLHAVLARVREVDGLLQTPAALHIALEVCKGLQYAHGFSDDAGRLQPVVHRDVTPHNILISYSGEVKLADFGIALAANKLAERQERVVRGKACYLSPEQAQGQAGEPRSDIFSLGTVLFEMLTGRRPFDAPSEREILERILKVDPEPPSTYNDEVDEATDAVVLRAMARAPEKRFARAGDLQVALTEILHRRWPGYTSEKLTETTRDLFAWEIAQVEGGSMSDSVRDRLLVQLSRAGVKVEDPGASTAELLELGTVAITAASRGSEGPVLRSRKVLGLLAGLAVLGVTLTAMVLAWTDTPTHPLKVVDAGPPPVPLAQLTEHLTPVSFTRQPEEKELTSSTGPGSPVREHRVALAAYLNCNSWPWSVVYIDGRRLKGNTPLFRVRVAAGQHRLRFVNPELGLSKEIVVSVEAGNTKTVAVSLQH